MQDRPPVELQVFIDAMSRLASGVNVVTTMGSGTRDGVTVSSACSVTAEPPTVLACINQDSRAAEAIERNGVLCLNVLSLEQRAISDAFARRVDGFDDRFSRGDWTSLITGAPVLTGAVAAFDCTVEKTIFEGTHKIFIARVVAAVSGDAEPLIYSRRSYAKVNWD
ncbi:MAG: flavin reductase [Gammaproteobacteria bacterium]|jgi:flavin reductase